MRRAIEVVGKIDQVHTVLPEESECYREIPLVLRDSGVERVELVTWGWWIGTGAGAAVAGVADHVACHLSNPLTGSDEARRGEAFVSMRDAYDRGGSMPEVVVWHTVETEGLSEKEILVAREAGCEAASPYVAPWAVGVRAAGLGFSAYLLMRS